MSSLALRRLCGRGQVNGLYDRRVAAEGFFSGGFSRVRIGGTVSNVIADGDLYVVFGIFFGAGLLEIVYLFKEVLFGCLEVCFLLVGDAQEHQLTFFYFAFYVFVVDAVDLGFAFIFFKMVPVCNVGHVQWDAHLNEG